MNADDNDAVTLTKSAQLRDTDGDLSLNLCLSQCWWKRRKRGAGGKRQTEEREREKRPDRGGAGCSRQLLNHNLLLFLGLRKG
eukprot:2758568-Rhodomonas_salina.1